MKKETIGSKFLAMLGNILWALLAATVKFLWKIFLFCLVGILQFIELLAGQLAKWLKKDVLKIN